jgi:hypothetical protein
LCSLARPPRFGIRYVRAQLDPADKRTVAPRDPVLGFLTLSEGYRIIRPDRTGKTFTFEIPVRPEKRPEGK